MMISAVSSKRLARAAALAPPATPPIIKSFFVLMVWVPFFGGFDSEVLKNKV
jgi:hypothetical protein